MLTRRRQRDDGDTNSTEALELLSDNPVGILDSDDKKSESSDSSNESSESSECDTSGESSLILNAQTLARTYAMILEPSLCTSIPVVFVCGVLCGNMCGLFAQATASAFVMPSVLKHVASLLDLAFALMYLIYNQLHLPGVILASATLRDSIDEQRFTPYMSASVTLGVINAGMSANVLTLFVIIALMHRSWSKLRVLF